MNFITYSDAQIHYPKSAMEQTPGFSQRRERWPGGALRGIKAAIANRRAEWVERRVAITRLYGSCKNAFENHAIFVTTQEDEDGEYQRLYLEQQADPLTIERFPDLTFRLTQLTQIEADDGTTLFFFNIGHVTPSKLTISAATDTSPELTASATPLLAPLEPGMRLRIPLSAEAIHKIADNIEESLPPPPQGLTA